MWTTGQIKTYLQSTTPLNKKPPLLHEAPTPTDLLYSRRKNTNLRKHFTPARHSAVHRSTRTENTHAHRPEGIFKAVHYCGIFNTETGTRPILSSKDGAGKKLLCLELNTIPSMFYSCWTEKYKGNLHLYWKLTQLVLVWHKTWHFVPKDMVLTWGVTACRMSLYAGTKCWYWHTEEQLRNDRRWRQFYD